MLILPTGQFEAAARDLEGASAEAILDWTYTRFPRVALVASFQAESIVLINLASRRGHPVEVVTLDTGRLPQETHDLIDLVGRRFPRPDPPQLRLHPLHRRPGPRRSGPGLLGQAILFPVRRPGVHGRAPG